MVLTWMILPAIAAMGKERHVEACHSNLRDLGIASRMYCADFDDMIFPDWEHVSPDMPASLCHDKKYRHIHLQFLEPYRSAGSSVICPASDPVDCCHPLERSYHPQTGLWRDENDEPCDKYLHQLGPPERTVLWGEGAMYLTIHPYELGPYVNHSVHSGGSNVCFADGHVAHVLKKDLLDLHYDGPWEPAL
jgi:prepilin-type processing-associated H-X9-DG protein